MKNEFLHSLFHKNLKDNPKKTFISFNNEKYSFEEVFLISVSLAEKLKNNGLKSGDRIILRFWNEPSFVFCYFAILLAEGIVVSVSPLLSKPELSAIKKHADAKLILSFENSEDLNQISFEHFSAIESFKLSKASLELDDEPNKNSDVAVIIYTSGTTGSPKGVMLTYENIKAQVEAAGEALQLTSFDSFLGILSFSHVFGQMDILWSALSVGCTIHLIKHFEAHQALTILAQEKVSILIAVPTMYQLMIRHLERAPKEFAHLRVCHSGAAPMPPVLFHKIESFFKAPMQEGYGLTETCSMAFSNPLIGSRKPGSVGLPIKDVEFQVRDESGQPISFANQIGEIYIRGAIITKGYFRAPVITSEAIDEDGWLLTGDLGYKDHDGYLFLVDRKKDLIIRSGHKVYPREVEEILLKHESVAQAAVIGIPHELQGQKVKAFIVPKNENLSEEQKASLIADLRVLCINELAKYKLPNFYEIVSDIPKTPSGKLLKRKLI